ncbi:MAG: asparaginase [Ilumatobacter sp.]|nr:asparaginase [Ilumatobacter sp.]
MSVPIEGTRFAESSFEPIAVATRSDVEESLHHGVGVVVGPDGSIVRVIGDPELLIYPRSALKPLQTAAMVDAGLDLPHRLLAVVSASHSGEQRHLDAVLEILQRHDLTVNDLGNTPGRPYGEVARSAARTAGVEPSRLQQNCSGKHAGMLATCRVNGWTTDSYLDPDHPLQKTISDSIDRLAARPGGSVADVGVDGCGAPTHLMPLVDVARALSVLMRGGGAAVASMAAEPFLVGGTDRDVTSWMEAVPGLVAKEGADGVMLLGLADGRAAAAKIADGSNLARRAVTVEMLRRLGVDVDGVMALIRDRVSVPVFGHGAPVGALTALPWG